MSNGPKQSIICPGGRLQLTSQCTDTASLTECRKLVTNFNREVALYCTLAVGLGGSNDSEKLRDELRNSRHRACDLAHQNKSKLMPLLISKMRRQEGDAALERLYHLYSGCLEILQLQLYKTTSLQRIFPLFSEETVLINTGVSEPVVTYKGLAVEHLDIDQTDKRVIEKEELLRLERAARDIGEIAYSVSQMVNVQYWDIEPEETTLDDPHNPVRKRSDTSISEDYNSTTEMTSVTATARSAKRKCLCVAIVTITTVILCCSIVGLLVGFLHNNR